jgi:CheY-like chemotaxis protein
MKSVMIVDDSEADQYLAQDVIEQFDPNIEIHQAFDGKEALEKLSVLDPQPDVIFLDINMPRMNGHEFLEVYSQWENHSKVVIMLTSSDQDYDKEKSKAHNTVINYFIKPLQLEALKSIVPLV